MPLDFSLSRDFPQAFILAGISVALTKQTVSREPGMHLHEGIINRDDKDLAGVLELGMGDELGDMVVGAGWGKGSWDADDDGRAVANLSGQVDLVAGVGLGEVDARNGISDLDHDCGWWVVIGSGRQCVERDWTEMG